MSWRNSHSHEILPDRPCLFIVCSRSSIINDLPRDSSLRIRLALFEEKGKNAMMRLKVEKIGEGLHPSEFVVTVHTRAGDEELVIDPKSLHGDSLVIGWPVGTDGQYRLVELPRPTSGGARRVWVKNDALINEEKVSA